MPETEEALRGSEANTRIGEEQTALTSPQVSLTGYIAREQTVLTRWAYKCVGASATLISASTTEMSLPYAYQMWTSSWTSHFSYDSLLFSSENALPTSHRRHEEVMERRLVNRAASLHAWREELKLRQIEEEKADATALSLFLSTLTLAEREEFERTKAVTVLAPSGKAYRVLTAFEGGFHGNVVELDNAGAPFMSHCCAPGGRTPVFDKFLGQILCLKYDEKNFIRTANQTPIGPDNRRFYERPIAIAA